MSGVSVAKKNGGQTSAIFANDTRWRPNSQILHRRDRSNSRVTETARPSGVPPSAARPSGVLLLQWLYFNHEPCKDQNCDFFSKRIVLNYPAFTFWHAHLEAVDNYTYLGTIFNYNGSFCKNINKQITQGKKHTMPYCLRFTNYACL